MGNEIRELYRRLDLDYNSLTYKKQMRLLELLIDNSSALLFRHKGRKLCIIDSQGTSEATTIEKAIAKATIELLDSAKKEKLESIIRHILLEEI